MGVQEKSLLLCTEFKCIGPLETLKGKVRFAMDKLKEQRYRGYVIAGIGGIVAFIAFFLPYVSVSAVIISISVSGSQIGGWLWFEFLAALVAIAIPLVLIYRNNAFGLTNLPIEKQIRYGIFTLIGAGAVGLLIELIAAINLHSALSGTTGVDPASIGVSVNLSIGYWLYLLASIAIVVGGVMAYRTMPALIAGQSWQYPSATQYPPYGQQYPGPSTQYPPYQSADQTPYPSYPGQYPQADQQQYQPTELKQPYPPTGPQQYQPTEYQQPPYPQQQYPQQQYPQQQYPPQQYPPSQ